MSVVNSKFATLLGKRKMKISEVHRLTGISRTTLTKLYYNEGSAISFETLAKICSKLNCQIEDIFEVQNGGDSGERTETH